MLRQKIIQGKATPSAEIIQWMAIASPMIIQVTTNGSARIIQGQCFGKDYSMDIQ
jgi:hypothetical protein